MMLFATWLPNTCSFPFPQTEPRTQASHLGIPWLSSPYSWPWSIHLISKTPLVNVWTLIHGLTECVLCVWLLSLHVVFVRLIRVVCVAMDCSFRGFIVFSRVPIPLLNPSSWRRALGHLFPLRDQHGQCCHEQICACVLVNVCVHFCWIHVWEWGCWAAQF